MAGKLKTQPNSLSVLTVSIKQKFDEVQSYTIELSISKEIQNKKKLWADLFFSFHLNYRIKIAMWKKKQFSIWNKALDKKDASAITFLIIYRKYNDTR